MGSFKDLYLKKLFRSFEQVFNKLSKSSHEAFKEILWKFYCE